MISSYLPLGVTTYAYLLPSRGTMDVCPCPKSLALPIRANLESSAQQPGGLRTQDQQVRISSWEAYDTTGNVANSLGLVNSSSSSSRLHMPMPSQAWELSTAVGCHAA
jgi:hypothetical protein